MTRIRSVSLRALSGLSDPTSTFCPQTARWRWTWSSPSRCRYTHTVVPAQEVLDDSCLEDLCLFLVSSLPEARREPSACDAAEEEEIQEQNHPGLQDRRGGRHRHGRGPTVTFTVSDAAEEHTHVSVFCPRCCSIRWTDPTSSVSMAT